MAKVSDYGAQLGRSGGSLASLFTVAPLGKTPDRPFHRRRDRMRANSPSAKTSKPIMNTREDSGQREELCSAQYLTLSASLTLHAFIFRTVLIVQDSCVLSCHCPETQCKDMKADVAFRSVSEHDSL